MPLVLSDRGDAKLCLWQRDGHSVGLEFSETLGSLEVGNAFGGGQRAAGGPFRRGNGFGFGCQRVEENRREDGVGDILFSGFSAVRNPWPHEWVASRPPGAAFADGPADARSSGGKAYRQFPGKLRVR